MPDKLKESAYALSGGQQQRLCIARAMAVSPSVLLMDEPASALDPISTAKVEELIHELKKDYVDESVGLLRVEDFIIKNASVSEKVANGDVLADDADAAAENAEQDSDQNVSDEDTDDSGQDNSDVDENLEEELGTEDVDQSE